VLAKANQDAGYRGHLRELVLTAGGVVASRRDGANGSDRK
jgi:hypothetical protein